MYLKIIINNIIHGVGRYVALLWAQEVPLVSTHASEHRLELFAFLGSIGSSF